MGQGLRVQGLGLSRLRASDLRSRVQESKKVQGAGFRAF